MGVVSFVFSRASMFISLWPLGKQTNVFPRDQTLRPSFKARGSQRFTLSCDLNDFPRRWILDFLWRRGSSIWWRKVCITLGFSLQWNIVSWRIKVSWCQLPRFFVYSSIDCLTFFTVRSTSLINSRTSNA